MPVRFQDRRCPNAPRATHESKALNMLLSVPCGAIYSLLLVAMSAMCWVRSKRHICLPLCS